MGSSGTNAENFKSKDFRKANHFIFGIKRYMTRRACVEDKAKLKKDSKIRDEHNKTKYKKKIEKSIKNLPRNSTHYARPKCPHRQYIDDDKFKLISHYQKDFLKSIDK